MLRFPELQVGGQKRCFSVVFAVFFALKLHLLGQNGTAGRVNRDSEHK
jgi:hypothetical protein